MNDGDAAPTVEGLRDSLVRMVGESWRFGRLFGRVLEQLDVGEQARYRNQYRWFSKKVEESLKAAALEIVNVEGQPFDPGIAASPLNLEDFATEDQLVVDQMVEPIIMGADGVVKAGTVTLKKVNS